MPSPATLPIPIFCLSPLPFWRPSTWAHLRPNGENGSSLKMKSSCLLHPNFPQPESFLPSPLLFSASRVGGKSAPNREDTACRGDGVSYHWRPARPAASVLFSFCSYIPPILASRWGGTLPPNRDDSALRGGRGCYFWHPARSTPLFSFCSCLPPISFTRCWGVPYAESGRPVPS